MEKSPVLKKLLFIFYLLEISCTLSPQDKSSNVVTQEGVNKLITEALASSGLGVLTRVRNQTNYPANIEFKKTIHDEIPDKSKGSFQRIDGLFLTCRKVDGKILLTFEKCEPQDPAAQWNLNRIKDDSLKDWIGLSHLNADGKYLEVDSATGIIQFGTTTFNTTTKNAHWQIAGYSLDSFNLMNRTTNGIVCTNTVVKEIADGEDKTTITREKSVAYLEFAGIIPKSNYNRNSSQFPVCIIDCYGQGMSTQSGSNPTLLAVDGFGPSTNFCPYSVFKKGDGSPHLIVNYEHRVRFNNPAMNQRIQFHRDTGQIHNVNGDDDWEEVIFEKREGFSGDGFIRWGEKVVLKSRHNTYARRNNTGYSHTAEDPFLSRFTMIPANFGYDMNAGHIPNHLKFNADGASSSWAGVKGFFEQIALSSGNNLYAISHAKKLYKFINNSWQSLNTSFKPKNMCATKNDELFCIDTENRLWIYSNNTWTARPGTFYQIACSTKDDFWAIVKDGGITRYKGGLEEQINLPIGQAIWISASNDGSLFAISSDKNGIWRFNHSIKNWVLIPGQQAKRLAVRSENEIWIVNSNDRLFQYSNGSWIDKGVYATDVAVASGITETKTIAARKKVTSMVLTTLDQEKKPLLGDATTPLKISLTEKGSGGGIPPGTSLDFAAIPITQYPRVTGFAADSIEDFDTTSILSIKALKSKGTTWLETPLSTINQGSLSLFIRSKDQGDAQIVFNDEISNTFVYKIVFGGWGNQKAALIKRELVNNKTVDTIVYEITTEQNPLAELTAGIFEKYWVSIDDNFITAGKGELGSNPFIAWRDPKPTSKITRVGFSCHSTAVQFKSIQLSSPVKFAQVPRIFIKTKLQFTATNSVDWQILPFRTLDRGSLQTRIQGNHGAAIILGSDRNIEKAHYMIVFGDSDNHFITIKKWYPDTKEYVERCKIKLDSLPDFKLDPKAEKTFWVSFYFGQIALGSGNIGNNPLYIYQDQAPIRNINSIGFKKTEPTSTVNFSTLSIAGPQVLEVAERAIMYKDPKDDVFFNGGITTILPFDYELIQESDSISVYDYVSDIQQYLAGTPQQGAIYKLQATINPNGMLAIDWTTAPTNLKKLEISRAILKLKNEAELMRIETEYARALAYADKKLSDAQADKDRAIATSLRETGASITRAAGEGINVTDSITNQAEKNRKQLGKKKTQSLTKTAVAGNFALLGAMLIGVGLTAAASGFDIKAAEKAYKGAELAAFKEKQAAIMDNQASIKQQLANASSEELAVGLLDVDSYVYLDKPGLRSAMAGVTADKEANLNAKAAQEKLDLAAKIWPDSTDDIKKLAQLYQEFILLINHESIFSQDQILKKRFLIGMDKLINHYNAKTITTLHQHFITLLLQSYNNPFLTNPSIPSELKIKESWYWYATRFGKELLAKNPLQNLILDKFYGEYLWLDEDNGYGFPKPNNGMIAFEAIGTDIFVCIAQEAQMVRNKNIELYEINIGGWNNTKTAIRLKSLDKYVAVVTKAENSDAMADATKFKKYWISCIDGVITIGCGDPGKGTILSWKDPYPLDNAKIIGLSSWNSAVQYRNIVVGDSTGITIEKQKTTDFDVTAALEELESMNKKFDDAYNKKIELDLVEAIVLEKSAVKVCEAIFKNKSEYSLDILTRFMNAAAILTQDLGDDDDYNNVLQMVETLDAEIPITKDPNASENPDELQTPGSIPITPEIAAAAA